MNVAFSLEVLLLTLFLRKGSLFRIPVINGYFQMLLTRPCLLELLDLSYPATLITRRKLFTTVLPSHPTSVLGARVHSGGLVMLSTEYYALFDVGAITHEIPFSNPRNTHKTIEIHISQEENRHEIKLLTN